MNASSGILGLSFGPFTVIEYKFWVAKPIVIYNGNTGEKKSIAKSELVDLVKNIAPSYYGKDGENLLGKTFGKLKVLHYAGKSDNEVIWLCKCRCGNFCFHSYDNLINGIADRCNTCLNGKESSPVWYKFSDKLPEIGSKWYNVVYAGNFVCTKKFSSVQDLITCIQCDAMLWMEIPSFYENLSNYYE